MKYRSSLLSTLLIIGSLRLQRKVAIEKLIQDRKRDSGRGVSAEGLKERTGVGQQSNLLATKELHTLIRQVLLYDVTTKSLENRFHMQLPIMNSAPDQTLEGVHLAKCR